MQVARGQPVVGSDRRALQAGQESPARKCRIIVEADQPFGQCFCRHVPVMNPFVTIDEI